MGGFRTSARWSKWLGILCLAVILLMPFEAFAEYSEGMRREFGSFLDSVGSIFVRIALLSMAFSAVVAVVALCISNHYMRKQKEVKAREEWIKAAIARRRSGTMHPEPSAGLAAAPDQQAGAQRFGPERPK